MSKRRWDPTAATRARTFAERRKKQADDKFRRAIRKIETARLVGKTAELVAQRDGGSLPESRARQLALIRAELERRGHGQDAAAAEAAALFAENDRQLALADAIEAGGDWN